MVTKVEATELLVANGWTVKLQDSSEFTKSAQGQMYTARTDNNEVYFTILGKRNLHSKATTREELIKELDLIY